ncbi:hypothetical protein [Tenacibaculum ovolyticum]
MKKQLEQLEQKSKLSLKKFQIAKIKNLHEIIGGDNANNDTVDTKGISI